MLVPDWGIPGDFGGESGEGREFSGAECQRAHLPNQLLSPGELISVVIPGDQTKKGKREDQLSPNYTMIAARVKLLEIIYIDIYIFCSVQKWQRLKT